MSICSACRNTTFRIEQYKNPAGPKTFRRRILDLIQWLGWHILPLEKLHLKTARRFAQGLFKFKHINVCTWCGLGTIYPMCSNAELTRYYTSFYANSDAGALPPIGLRGSTQADYLKMHLDLSKQKDSFETGAGNASLSRAVRQIAPQLNCTIEELSHDMLTLLRNCSDKAPSVFFLLFFPAKFSNVSTARAAREADTTQE